MNEQIRLQKGERVILERRYDSILPVLLMILGAIDAMVGLLICIVLEEPSLLVLGLVGVVLIILGNYLKSAAAFRLTVTDKRVVQDGPFGQFVVLPLNRITAASGNRKTLNVSSAGGRITLGIPDSVSVCNTIAGLLNQLQEEVEVPAATHKQNDHQQPRSQNPQPPKEKSVKFVHDNEPNPFDEDAEFVDVCCPECQEPLSFVVGSSEGMCPECGAKFDLQHHDAAAPASQAQPTKPIEPTVDITPYLGKKFCSGCGELVSDPNVTVCPECGSKYLGVITRTNAMSIIPNIEKH